MNFTMHSKLVHVSYSDVVGQQLSVVGQHLVSSEIVQWLDGNCSVPVQCLLELCPLRRAQEHQCLFILPLTKSCTLFTLDFESEFG